MLSLSSGSASTVASYSHDGMKLRNADRAATLQSCRRGGRGNRRLTV